MEESAFFGDFIRSIECETAQSTTFLLKTVNGDIDATKALAEKFKERLNCLAPGQLMAISLEQATVPDRKVYYTAPLQHGKNIHFYRETGDGQCTRATVSAEGHRAIREHDQKILDARKAKAQESKLGKK